MTESDRTVKYQNSNKQNSKVLEQKANDKVSEWKKKIKEKEAEGGYSMKMR